MFAAGASVQLPAHALWVGLIPVLGAMSKTSATWAVIGITVANLALVGLSSIFAVYGDGSPGAAPLVLGVGAAWVLGFACRGAALVNRGEYRAAAGAAAKALPYAFATLVLGGSLVLLVAITFGW